MQYQIFANIMKNGIFKSKCIFPYNTLKKESNINFNSYLQLFRSQQFKLYKIYKKFIKKTIDFSYLISYDIFSILINQQWSWVVLLLLWTLLLWLPDTITQTWWYRGGIACIVLTRFISVCSAAAPWPKCWVAGRRRGRLSSP